MEIVTVGDELLLGETVDDNAAWLGRRMVEAGIRVSRGATVADEAEAIRDEVRSALERTGTVLCTGGLGPTRDDRTKAAVADLFGQPLVLDEDLLDSLTERFRARGWDTLPSANRTQAEVPEHAVVFPNPLGTAPGLALEDDTGRLAVLLPGVPDEMRAIVRNQVLPFLADRWPERSHPVRHRLLRTTGIPESEVAGRVDELTDALAPLSVAFLPSPLGVDLRITSWGDLDTDEAARRLDDAAARLAEPLDGFVYATGGEDLVAVLARTLTARGLTLALAESCTGGLLGKRITDRPGASSFLEAGFVVYADAAKQSLLGVREATLREHGAVSEAVVREMAEGARRVAGTDAAIAVTGIAGPAGGTVEKPVGTVWLGAALGERTRSMHQRYGGDRGEIRARSAQGGLALLWRMLQEEAR